MEHQALTAKAEVSDGNWALIDLTDELTNRATLVANEMGIEHGWR